MSRINNFLSITVPVKTAVTAHSTVPIKHAFENLTMQTVKKMPNPKGNPLLRAIKRFANNPQRLQTEIQELLKTGKENLCNHLVDILSQFDENTAHHAHGVAKIVTSFAKYHERPVEEIRDLKLAALIHDIGKIGVPRDIVTKRGRLNDAENAIMKMHTLWGEKFLEQLGLTKISKSFKHASKLAAKHHLDFDELVLSNKTEFPDKEVFKVEALKLSDVFNALTIKRSYHKPLSPMLALRQMDTMQRKYKKWNPEIYQQFKNFIRENYISKSAN